MSGIKYLLDTNFILGMLKRTPEVLEVLSAARLTSDQCAYSAITRMELLGFPGITPPKSNSSARPSTVSSTSASASRSKRLQSEYVEPAAQSCLTP